MGGGPADGAPVDHGGSHILAGCCLRLNEEIIMWKAHGFPRKVTTSTLIYSYSYNIFDFEEAHGKTNLQTWCLGLF